MTRSKIILSLALLTGLAFAFPAFAQEQITNFDTSIQINTDASINVTEQIVYDFGQTPRHGIFRTIPQSYKARGGNYNLRISEISVLDELGRPYTFEATSHSGYLDIKIGDPNLLIAGEHTYNIQYSVKRAINFYADHDELYWNATGDQWNVPILHATAQIFLNSSNIQSMQILCFRGSLGSTTPCEENLGGKNLLPGEGLTVVASIPKGAIHKPTVLQEILATIRDNAIVFLPFLVFFGLLYLWFRTGRDPRGTNTIVAQYEAPDSLSPLEIGTIIDEQADRSDVSAELIYLAVNGYLKIREVEDKGLIFSSKDYILEKLKSHESLQNEFQKKLMIGIFGRTGDTVRLSSLKNKFYTDLAKIQAEVYESLVLKDYFVRNPKTVRSMWAVGGGITIVLGFLAAGYLGILGIVSFTVSGILVMIFGIFMPRRTAKGVLAKEHILGLKTYLTVAEKDRIKFHNAPEKKPEQFEKLLPFAMALGVEREWAKQFEGIYNSSPAWYHSSTGNFNSIFFVSSLDHFSSATNAVVAAKPGAAAGGGSGFGGGGFSGGGFGGGGGGSW